MAYSRTDIKPKPNAVTSKTSAVESVAAVPYAQICKVVTESDAAYVWDGDHRLARFDKAFAALLDLGLYIGAEFRLGNLCLRVVSENLFADEWLVEQIKRARRFQAYPTLCAGCRKELSAGIEIVVENRGERRTRYVHDKECLARVKKHAHVAQVNKFRRVPSQIARRENG